MKVRRPRGRPTAWKSLRDRLLSEPHAISNQDQWVDIARLSRAIGVFRLWGQGDSCASDPSGPNSIEYRGGRLVSGYSGPRGAYV